LTLISGYDIWILKVADENEQHWKGETRVGDGERVMAKTQLGLIGFGYWGPNLARNINANPRCILCCIADLNSERREIAGNMYPHIEVVEDPQVILKSPQIDVVAIATPVSSHFELARQAIENGKHVWIEKPLAATSAESAKLVDLARQKHRILMVDHTFLFTSSVKKIHEVIRAGELGNILYYDSVRVNLGLIQSDVNVIWDLAPHDLSIMDFVLEQKPSAISVHGKCHFGTKLEEIAYLSLYYENNLMAHLHVNWLSPVKIRHTLIGGDKKMLVWNDLDNENKVNVYDKGVEVMQRENGYVALTQYRIGNMASPALANTEALTEELDYLLDCIAAGQEPFNNGEAGHRVVEILEAADHSLKNSGKLIELLP
jgi:predicted dehydrogenase